MTRSDCDLFFLIFKQNLINLQKLVSARGSAERVGLAEGVKTSRGIHGKTNSSICLRER